MVPTARPSEQPEQRDCERAEQQMHQHKHQDAASHRPDHQGGNRPQLKRRPRFAKNLCKPQVSPPSVRPSHIFRNCRSLRCQTRHVGLEFFNLVIELGKWTFCYRRRHRAAYSLGLGSNLSDALLTQ